MSKILIVDLSNTFFRNFVAYPQLTSNGEQIGGVVGTLKMLRHFMSEMRPTRVYIVWESGGSKRRKKIYSEYKQNRMPVSMNRFYGDDIPDTEENRFHQMKVLLELLKNVPVFQVYVQDCEADDVIAFIMNNMHEGDEKVIVSTDKDFYSLLDNAGKRKIYDLNKKIFIDYNFVLKNFFVSSRNFALAKAMVGDPSDNIPGIRGLGFKTVGKKFPLLMNEEEDVLLDHVFSYAHSRLGQGNVYKHVLDGEDVIRRNWKLVYLGNSIMSPQQIARLQELIDNFEMKSNKYEFMSIMSREGITNFDVDGFFNSFVFIERVELKSRG